MLTNSIVWLSRREIISHSTFPTSVSSRKHRWPIANFSKSPLSSFPTLDHVGAHLRLCPDGAYPRIDGILLPFVLVRLLELIHCGP